MSYMMHRDSSDPTEAKPAAFKLRDIHGLRPLYILPADPFVSEALIPAFKVAKKISCMVGFFSSQVLVSLAPGLATFINEQTGCMRLIISPILSPEDLAAVEQGLQPIELVANAAVEKLLVSENEIQEHTLRCLSSLIRAGRIEIRIAVIKNGLFHPKVWLFDDCEDNIAAHGSSNVTHAGLWKNIEQISVSCSWSDPNQSYIVQKFREAFEQFWNNKQQNCMVMPLSRAVEDKVIQNYNTATPPKEGDLATLYEKLSATKAALDTDTTNNFKRESFQFKIPHGLQYESGPFAHQGKAVEAWCANGYKGVVEMATGAGKTITAMLCAFRLSEARKQLLIVLSAPYIPLLEQWCEEVKEFGLRPFNMTTLASQERGEELQKLRRRFRNGSSKVEIIIVSNDTLCSAAFMHEIAAFKCDRMLIADEAHHLGSESFISATPDFFEYRLALSATPIRQYDTEGTDALFQFFGPIVFRFTLEEAIGSCLVPYDYFVHPVELTDDEMESWCAISNKIKQNYWRAQEGNPDDFLQKLFRDRRALLESAEKKVSVFRTLLLKENLKSLKHTLVYTSDKQPEQIKQVNKILLECGVVFHQLTQKETRDRLKMQQILMEFQRGNIQILTAKRVLDEGVNIPQINKAFILASTTVERQWTQRRGRLLRTCKETNKVFSEIHDLIALPPETFDGDKERKAIIKSELKRAQEFARLSRNAGLMDGSLHVIDQLVKSAYT